MPGGLSLERRRQAPTSGHCPGWSTPRNFTFKLGSGKDEGEKGARGGRDQRWGRSEGEPAEDPQARRQAGNSRAQSEEEGREPKEEEEQEPIQKEETAITQEEAVNELIERARSLAQLQSGLTGTATEEEIGESPGVSLPDVGRSSHRTAVGRRAGRRGPAGQARRQDEDLHVLSVAAAANFRREVKRQQRVGSPSALLGPFGRRATSTTRRFAGGQIDRRVRVNASRMVHSTPSRDMGWRGRIMRAPPHTTAGAKAWSPSGQGRRQGFMESWIRWLGISRCGRRKRKRETKRKRWQREIESKRSASRMGKRRCQSGGDPQEGGRVRKRARTAASLSDGWPPLVVGAAGLLLAPEAAGEAQAVLVEGCVPSPPVRATLVEAAGCEGLHDEESLPSISSEVCQVLVNVFNQDEWMEALKAAKRVTTVGPLLAWGYRQGWLPHLFKSAGPPQPPSASRRRWGLFPLPVHWPDCLQDGSWINNPGCASDFSADCWYRPAARPSTNCMAVLMTQRSDALEKCTHPP